VAPNPEQEKKRMSTPKTDDNGIHELGDGRLAWFGDPGGNTFAIADRSAL
jgi:hypothetical protein